MRFVNINNSFDNFNSNILAISKTFARSYIFRS